MATAKGDLERSYASSHPNLGLKDAARQMVKDNVKPHKLPDTFSITIVNAADSVKTACFLNNKGTEGGTQTIDYSAYSNLQEKTTSGGLTYSTSYKPGLAGLRKLLRDEKYVIAGYTLDAQSDANAASQFSADITFERINVDGLVQKVTPLQDALQAAKDKSSFNQQRLAIQDAFVCSDRTDTVIDIIASGKLIVTFVHADKVSGGQASY